MTVLADTPVPADDVAGVLGALDIRGVRYLSFDPPAIPPPRPQMPSVPAEVVAPVLEPTPDPVDPISTSSSEPALVPPVESPSVVLVAMTAPSGSPDPRGIEPRPTHALVVSREIEPPIQPSLERRVVSGVRPALPRTSMAEVFHTIGSPRRPISLRDAFVSAGDGR